MRPEVEKIVKIRDKAVENFISDRGVDAKAVSDWSERLKKIDPLILPKLVPESILNKYIPNYKEDDLQRRKCDRIIKTLNMLPNLTLEDLFPSMYNGKYSSVEYAEDEFNYMLLSAVIENLQDRLIDMAGEIM